jgi:signal transduction histidine kinase
MFSNLTKKNQTFEESEDLRKIRILLISSLISYPLWGLLSKYMEPNAYDPIWQRLVCSLISGIILYLSYSFKNFLKHQEKFYTIIWIFTYHLLFLFWKNSSSVYYALCNVIQFPYVILSFPTKRTAQIFTYTNFLVISLFAYFLPSTKNNPWFFVISMITIGHYVMTVLVQHFNVVTSLKKTKLEFDLALTNMFEGVILMDREGIINSYNNAVLNLLSFNGYSQVSMSYKQTCLYEHCLKENLDEYTEADHPFKLALDSHSPLKNIVMGLRINGETRWLLFNIQPFDNSQNILISFSDITAIKIQEEVKVAKQAQMAMNARLSSLFAVAGGVAHEINNPLGIVIARLQSLNKKIDNDHIDKAYFKNSISKTINAAYRISKIISSLMSLSKSTDEVPEKIVKLSDIIDDTLLMWTENFKIEGINLLVDDIPKILIKCCPIQISQVLHNILSNSYDSTMNNDVRWVHVSFIDLINSIKIIVTDSGPEIPREIKLKMMDPFFTTKDIGKGTGLGLSISKSIIEKHNGQLSVDIDSPLTKLSIELNKENFLH